MSHIDVYTFLVCIHLCFLCFILLSEKSYGVNQLFEACRPKDCGNGLNISFPFYINGVQQPICGYPGFQLSCNDRDPVLRLSENDYVVKNISYETQTLRVYNAALSSNTSNSCLPEIKNISLPGGQFDYVNTSNIYFLSNCNESLYKDFAKYKVPCLGGKVGFLAVYEGDENLKNIVGKCTTEVVAPVEKPGELGGGSGTEDYVEVMRRGFVMNWTASDCSRCRESGGWCGFNQTNHHFRCFCPDRPHASSCKPVKKRTTLVVATVTGGVAAFILLLTVSFIIWRAKKKKGYLMTRNLSLGPSSKLDIEGGNVFFGIPIFSFAELEGATNSFDSSKELGDGGFGTVYYGKLKDGREVAIKRMYENNYKRVQQFMNEIKILTCLRHRNLVSLYGCTSRRSRELLLVYEYVPNGTVADHLHGDRAKEAPLSWPVRVNIAIETASALAYLHASDIIHRDVKTTNILLDDSFCVKVADFGLSRLLPNDVTHISTAPQGTPGYVDPEYHQCYQLTDRSDVYSFGVVLIELISSMPAVDISRHRHDINLATFAVNRIQRCAFDELIDQSLGYKSDPEVQRMTTSVAELAFRCLQLEKEMRPDMNEVLEVLKEIKGSEENNADKTRGSEMIPHSPETDSVVLLKNRNIQSSPNAVTDVWVSSSSTTTSSIG